MCMGLCIGMCMDMCIDMCEDMCMGICTGMCIRYHASIDGGKEETVVEVVLALCSVGLGSAA